MQLLSTWQQVGTLTPQFCSIRCSLLFQSQFPFTIASVISDLTGSHFIFSYQGHLTTRSDVYSFGVVLLEMLTGRRAVDKNRPQGEHNLVEWAKPYLTSKRRILNVMDTRLEGQYSLGGVLRAATLAMKCLAIEPKYRPNMNEVVRALEQLQDLPEGESTRSTESVQSSHSSKSSTSVSNHNRRCTNEACHLKDASYHRPAASPIHA